MFNGDTAVWHGPCVKQEARTSVLCNALIRNSVANKEQDREDESAGASLWEPQQDS